MVIFSRYFEVLSTTLAIALTAYFTAKGAGNFIALALRHELPPAIPAPDPPNATHHDAPAYKHEVLGTAVLDRNIFDSSRGSISRHPPSPEESAEPEAETTPALVPCTDITLRLQATLAVPGSPDLSMASVATPKDAELYRIGDPLGDGHVALISWQYLIIDEPEGYCYLDLFEKRAPKVGRKELKRSIKKRGRRREMKRAIFERIMSDPRTLLKGIKVRPYEKRQSKGYLISSLQRTHPAYLLGLRKRDIVLSINGQPLSSVTGALSAIHKLGHKGTLKVELLRRGRPTALEIQLK